METEKYYILSDAEVKNMKIKLNEAGDSFILSDELIIRLSMMDEAESEKYVDELVSSIKIGYALVRQFPNQTQPPKI